MTYLFHRVYEARNDQTLLVDYVPKLMRNGFYSVETNNIIADAPIVFVGHGLTGYLTNMDSEKPYQHIGNKLGILSEKGLDQTQEAIIKDLLTALSGKFEKVK